MTYGVSSNQTDEILRAAGLIHALLLDEADETVIEVDVLFEGALDESFAVQPGLAEDVVEVLFEALAAEFESAEFEVSAWDRTNPDDCREVLTRGHEGLSDDGGSR